MKKVFPLSLYFKYFVFLVLFLTGSFYCFALPPEYDGKMIHLEENWELYIEKTPEQVFASANQKIPSDFTVTVPDYWDNEIEHFNGHSTNTFGCYRYVCTGLKPLTKYAIFIKDSPSTSYNIFANRVLVAEAGDPYAMTRPDFNINLKGYYRSKSQSKPVYCEFYSDKSGEIEIVVFLSNYIYRKGGLWDSVYFGSAESVSRSYILLLLFYAVIIGSLFFIGLLNITQFVINKNKWEYFYLGITSIIFALRIGTAEFCIFTFIIPSLSYEVKCKIEYMVLWAVPVSILQMLFRIYPSRERTIIFKWLKERPLRHFIIILDLILGVISLALPAYYSNKLVPHLQIGMGIIALYVVTFAISNLIKRRKYALHNALSYSTMAMGAISDIIYSKSKSIIPISTLPFFLVVFVIIQILMLAEIQNDIYKNTIKSSNDLERLNKAYLRFVPKEFLHLLNKESIIKTKLGDYSNIEMSIMFSKVNIESDDDNDSLEEHFLIFNDYLKKVSPIIKKYDGFVSKFLSGGFMALFPNSEVDAVRAALEINDCIKKYTFTSEQHVKKISAWSGIHYGKMIIGTIGEENRMDDTVISDTVNTAARIESVCEKLNKSIIVSEALEKLLQEQSILNISLSPLDAIYVKGKEKPLQLYEISRKSNLKEEDK